MIRLQKKNTIMNGARWFVAAHHLQNSTNYRGVSNPSSMPKWCFCVWIYRNQILKYTFSIFGSRENQCLCNKQRHNSHVLTPAANLAGFPPGFEILVCFNTRYVPGQNFLVSQPILIIVGVLESIGSLLSKTLKIVEIGSEMTKFWSQTYATVTS